MRFESYVVAELLQRLEQQSAELRPNAVEIATVLNKDNKDEYPTALEASAGLHRALDAFVAITEMLEDHIVAHDGMGELGESLGELELRARGMVLVAQIDRLSEVFGDHAVEARTRGWFIGKVQGITDVVAFVRGQLTKIHAMWMAYRQDQPLLPGMTDTDRANLYRTMVRVAQRAMRELWNEPELARFLDCGLAATDLVDVNLACKQIVSVLGLQIKPRRICATNGAAARR